MEDLNIGVKIPIDYISKVSAILAKRDSGKTYTAGVLEEELLDKRLPTIILDPMNAHWGIRTKYPVVIFGGSKADIEITKDDGEVIAELIINQNLTCIIDMSDWAFEEMREFGATFGRTLYRLNTSPRHIIIEEADIFVPQKIQNKECFLAFDAIVRRGRQKGLGVTMITQRPAVLNKDVLTQADVVFFMNLVAEQDMKVVNGLLDSSGIVKDEKKELIKKIMKFKQGEAIMFSPSWLNKIKYFKVRERETHHAGATVSLGKVEDPQLVPVVTDHLVKNLNTINDEEEGQTEEVLKVIHINHRNYAYAVVLFISIMAIAGYLS